MDTIFDKPLDKQVTDNSQAIANITDYEYVAVSNVACYYERKGNAVCVTFNGQSPGNPVFTLKQGCRPAQAQRCFLSSSSSAKFARGLIETTGEVKIVGATDNNEAYYGQCVFVIN